MNLATYRARVARQSGMSGSDSTDLGLIDGWVNEGIEQFLKETKINVQLMSLAVTAGTDDYALSSGVLFMQALWYAPVDAQSAMLEQVTPERIARMRLLGDTAGSTPRCYALAGAHTLMVYPAPLSSSDTLQGLYGPKPSSVMSATADSPSSTAFGNIPSEYHPIIESYAKWKACEVEEHKPSQYGQLFQKQYEDGVIKTKVDLARKSGPVAPAVTIGRSRPVVSSPGVDWR